MTELADLPETGTGELHLALTRRLVAEAVGTCLLIIAVIGSGIMASRLSPTDVGIQLLENAFATAGALVGLILMFGSVSGAHFNPVVSGADWLLGRRGGTGMSGVENGQSARDRRDVCVGHGFLLAWLQDRAWS